MKKIISMADLRKRRIELGMTQQNVADKAGVCLKTYADWENGKRKPVNKLGYRALEYALECEFETRVA